MNLIAIIAILFSLVLFVGGLWLYRYSQAKIIHLAVIASQRITLHPMGKISLTFSSLRENSIIAFTSLLAAVFLSGDSLANVNAIAGLNKLDIVRSILGSHTQTARYSGMATLAKRAYEGRSINISLILNRQSLIQGLQEGSLTAQDAANGMQVSVVIPEDSDQLFLEAELLAAAFTVAGDTKQQQSLNQERLQYFWNCSPNKSGDQQIILVLRVKSPASEHNLGYPIERNIQVVKIDHISQRSVLLMGAGLAVLGAISTVITILSAIHNWNTP